MPLPSSPLLAFAPGVLATLAAVSAAVRAICLGERRESLLLTGTLAELDKLDAEARSETFHRDQGTRMAEELRRKLAAAQAADAAAARDAERARIEGLMATAEKEMAAFPGHVGAIRKMLGAIATADAAAELFERKNRGDAPIPRAEARVRYERPAPHVRDERRVWAWVALDGRIAASDNPGTVRPAEDVPSNNSIRSTISGEWARNCLAEMEAGTLRPRPAHVFRTNYGQGLRVWPEQVTRREIEETGMLPLYSLAETIKLPPLRAGERECQTGDGSATSVLAALDLPPTQPLTKMRVELVPDPKAVRRSDLPAPPKPQGYDHRAPSPGETPDAAGISFAR